jgi:2-oxoglutarate ferredoxin oxidoreductase subunit delta
MRMQREDRPIRSEIRYTVEINEEECKGCGLCVEACPLDLLHLQTGFNGRGYHPAEFQEVIGEGRVARACSGCGVCFYACPEPGAITILGDEGGVSSKRERGFPEGGPEEERGA